MKTVVVEAMYINPVVNNGKKEIVFFIDKEPWWCMIIKDTSGDIVIKRMERDAFGKIIKYPNIPIITEYASEEGRFQLSLIWEDETDMNLIMECQLVLLPMLETTDYNDDIQFTIQY